MTLSQMKLALKENSAEIQHEVRFGTIEEEFQ
jgi:hypothetical protein